MYNVRNIPIFVTSTKKEVLDITLGIALMNESFILENRITRLEIEGKHEVGRVAKNLKRTDWD